MTSFGNIQEFPITKQNKTKQNKTKRRSTSYQCAITDEATTIIVI